MPIRVVARALDVLKSINRERPLTMMEIARECNLPYPTTCRIVQTLVHEGIVEPVPNRKTYRAAALAQALGVGYQTGNALAAEIRPSLIELSQLIEWPCAFLTRVGESMMIRDSTHGFSPKTTRKFYPGLNCPIWLTAPGKIQLAYCGSKERSEIITALRASESRNAALGEKSMLTDDYLNYLVSKVRADGFAWHENLSRDPLEEGASCVAVPLTCDSDYLGVLAVNCSARAIPAEAAASEFLPALRKAQSQISQSAKRAA